MMNYLYNGLFWMGNTLLQSFLIFLALILVVSLPLNNRLNLFKSKRDPFFWDEAMAKGSPTWLMRMIIIRFFFAIIAANFLTPIISTVYTLVFGVGQGGFSEQFNTFRAMMLNIWGGSLWAFITNIWPFNWRTHLEELPVVWTTIFSAMAIWMSFYVVQRWNAAKYRATTEFGGAEFTEPAEARQQYQAIPDRGLRFEGYGGVPMMHQYNFNLEGFKLYLASVRPKSVPTQFYDYAPQPVPKDKSLKKLPGRYFIDGKAVNTIILGETRAGKGETAVLATIDIVARGSADQSLVVADMKGELFTKTNDLLRRNNYDVKVLNFDNLNYSMSMNLLSQALYYAKRSNWAQTRQKISQLANTIYAAEDANANERFWINGASSTFSGLALATIWLLKREDEWEKMTIANVVNLLQQLATSEEQVTLENTRLTPKQAANPTVQKKVMNRLDLLVSVMDKEAQKLRDQGESDPLLDMAIASFNQAGMGSTDTKGNIYSSMFANVELFTSDISVQKMTTIDDFRYSSVGFPRVMEMQLPEYFANRKVSIAFKVGDKQYTEYVIADEMGLVQFAIEPKLDDRTVFTMTFDIEDNYIPDSRHRDIPIVDRVITVTAVKKYEKKGLRPKLDPYTGLPIIMGYVVKEITTNITVGRDDIVITFDYSEKRTAIFVVLPPLKKEYYQLALFFMEQLYQDNYDWANRNKNKNINRIHFLMDEFGNFPKWPDMSTKLSAALGYNFAFTMVLQNLEQLTEVYGKEGANTLVGNSSNFMYIKSSSLDTVEEISRKLGMRTIRMSNPGHDNPSGEDNVSSKERALLTAEELMKLRPGQMIAFRSAKNNDNRGASVATHPLYDYGWTSMPFAFNLLRGYMADSTELSRVSIQSPHRFLNLNDYNVNFKSLLDKLYDEVYGTNTSSTSTGTQTNSKSSGNSQRPTSENKNGCLISKEQIQAIARDADLMEKIKTVIINGLEDGLNEQPEDPKRAQMIRVYQAKIRQAEDIGVLNDRLLEKVQLLKMVSEDVYSEIQENIGLEIIS